MSDRIIYTASDIAALRAELGLSMREMGIKLGVSRSMVNQLENGTKSPSPVMALLLGHVATAAEVEYLGVMVDNAAEFLR